MPEANRVLPADRLVADDDPVEAAGVEHATAAMAAAGLSPATVAAYSGYLLRAGRFTAARGVALIDADAELLSAYAARAGASYISRKHLRLALVHFYRAHGRQAPALPAWTPAEPLRRLVALPDPRAVLEVAIADGGRRGAALALVVGSGLTTTQVAALPFDQLGYGRLRLGDGHRVLELPLHPVAGALLDEMRGPSEYAFPSWGRHGHVYRDTVMGWLAELCAEGGLPRLSIAQLRSMARFWSADDPEAVAVARAIRGRPVSLELDRRKRSRTRSEDPAVAERQSQLRRHLIGLGRSPSTVRSYVGAIARAERHFARAGRALSEADVEDIAEYSSTLPRDRSTLALVRSALAAYAEALAIPDQSRAVRVPSKLPMRSRALSAADAERLAAVARDWGGPAGVAVLLGLYLALRPQEIARVRFTDFADGWLTVIGKGNKSARLPVAPEVSQAVATLPRRSLWLFPSPLGAGPVSPTTVWSWVRDVADAAGVGHVSTHLLRHTALTMANEATGDLRAVQEFARHARPETTAGYTRVSEARLLNIAGAIRYGTNS